MRIERSKNNRVIDKNGVNRAESNNPISISIYENSKGNQMKVCVFISHRSTDKKAAAEIAKYLKDNGVDVYIDVNDKGLQIATSDGDSEAVVKYIQEGIKRSTHILVLISDDTRESWWVPYEIGYAEKAEKKIASMLLEQKEVECFPDYLRITERLFSANDFYEYVRNLKKAQYIYGGMFANNSQIVLTGIENVSKYIKEVRLD